MDRTLIVIFVAAAIGIAIVMQRHSVRTSSRTAATSARQAATASASASAQALNCTLAEAPKLYWPLEGTAGKNWVIANYVDLEPASNQIRDFTGAIGDKALTYDAHAGVDIEIADFRAMDSGIPVLASADGEVIEIGDGEFDRNMSCASQKWNFVTLKHPAGFRTTYGHLRAGSLAVKVGDKVRRGAKLGWVGSSGCSTYPHLHIEVRDCREMVVDPFKENLFISPPLDPRSAAAGVMEMRFFQPPLTSIVPIQDPGNSDAEHISVGYAFSVGLTLSHLRTGDHLRIELRSPDGALVEKPFERAIGQFLPRSHWWASFTPDQVGPWRAIVKINDRVLEDRSVFVGQ